MNCVLELLNNNITPGHETVFIQPFTFWLILWNEKWKHFAPLLVCMYITLKTVYEYHSILDFFLSEDICVLTFMDLNLLYIAKN